jgi:hypothetical protein
MAINVVAHGGAFAINFVTHGGAIAINVVAHGGAFAMAINVVIQDITFVTYI